MRTVTATEAKAKLAALLRHVELVGPVVITRSGRAVAEMRRTEPTAEDEAFAQGAEAIDRIAKGGATPPPETPASPEPRCDGGTVSELCPRCETISTSTRPGSCHQRGCGYIPGGPAFEDLGPMAGAAFP